MSNSHYGDNSWQKVVLGEKLLFHVVNGTSVEAAKEDILESLGSAQEKEKALLSLAIEQNCSGTSDKGQLCSARVGFEPRLILLQKPSYSVCSTS